MARRSESYSQLGCDQWQQRCKEDGHRVLLDLKALPYARGSHGAPLIRTKIVQALESVGKLRQGTCVVYNSGLYDGGLCNIKPSGWGISICLHNAKSVRYLLVLSNAALC